SCTEISNARCVTPATVNTNTIQMTVTPQPPKPSVTQTAGDLNSSSAGGNQWFLNANTITGAINQGYHPVVDGSYQVQVTVNGCKSLLSDPFAMKIEGVNLLYPVPG